MKFFTRDASKLKQCKSWTEFFTKTHIAARRDGFNAMKVNAFLRMDPEYDRLIDLAEGIRIDLPTTFVRSGPPNKLRNLQKVLLNTYSCLYQKLWLKGQGVILRLEDIPSALVEELHFMDSNWTPKQDSLTVEF